MFMINSVITFILNVKRNSFASDMSRIGKGSMMRNTVTP